MTSLNDPSLETRRTPQLTAELIARAKAWLPAWRPADPASDLAGALFAIAARFESEVAQRLNQVPEKMYRGFLQWLGVRGQAAQAAQIPLVFALTPGAQTPQPVLAQAPIQAQATPPQTGSDAPDPITFETEDDLMIVPGSLAALIAADPANDQYYQAPAGFSLLDGPSSGPAQWTLAAAARAGSTQVQLTPPAGIDASTTLVIANTNYQVTQAQGGLVTIDPPLEAAVKQEDSVTRLASFRPFGASGGNARMLQEHALYIGSKSLLDLPSSATIGVNGIENNANISWSYLGTEGTDATVTWRPLSNKLSAAVPTLAKNAGVISIATVQGISSRWLKATVPVGAKLNLSTSRISLTINATGCGGQSISPNCPPLSPPATPVALEGMANTTPLVLSTSFYPLGREPRLFDAFYLACPEAFAKTGASVSICLQALDGTADSFTAVGASTTNTAPALFAIGSDGFLHRMRQAVDKSPPVVVKAAVRPPLDQAGRSSVKTAPAFLSSPQGRLTACTRKADSLVAAVAGQDVWVWSENPDPDINGTWAFLGAPAQFDQSAKKTDRTAKTEKDTPPATLLLTSGDQNDPQPVRMVALIGRALYQAPLPADWQSASSVQWTRVAGTRDRHWNAIAPVFDEDSHLRGAPNANGWIAVASDGSALLFFGPVPSTSPIKLPDLGTGATPLAIHLTTTSSRGQILLVSSTPTQTIGAWLIDAVKSTARSLGALTNTLAGDSFDFTAGALDGPGAFFATGADGSNATAVAVWYPLATTLADPKIAYLSPPTPRLKGSPALVADFAFSPGQDAGIVISPFDSRGLARTLVAPDNLATAAVLNNSPNPPAVDDYVLVKDGSTSKVLQLPELHHPEPNRYWFAVPGSASAKPIASADIYRPEKDALYDGTVASANEIDNAGGDPNTHRQGDQLVVTHPRGRLTLHTLTAPPVAGPLLKLTITPQLTTIVGKSVRYRYVNKLSTPRLLPLLTQSLSSDFDQFLRTAGASIGGAQPSSNPLLFADTAANPTAYIFQNNWTTLPDAVSGSDGKKYFALFENEIFTDPTFAGGPVAADPALSWEYFNGNAWAKIPNLNDLTSNLRSTGNVSFCVPSMQQTDVAGNKSYWIRARLVGGDYGQETVTVTNTPGTGGSTVQTITRSDDSIDPPQLGSVSLTYSLCCQTNPDVVLTSDGGITSDQTAVNDSSSAAIQLFVPLSTSIQSAAAKMSDTDASAGPALYLGFNGIIQGGPVNLLFLLTNQDLSAAYPLRVEALLETGFVTVTVVDGTRGLGESGIVTVYLPTVPPQVNLFGSSLRWLRVRPNKLMTAAWTPQINSAYVNAVYALASETQRIETLGSSDGSPGQMVTVARPPVLTGSLEMRISEPLGDDEIAALRASDPNKVITTLDDATVIQSSPSAAPPQSWVLWTEVDVIEGAAKTDRVYELDNDTGEITFGDGKHGMIPPIGQDSIVARVYKRGGGSAANLVTAWSPVSLISPIQGISQVVAPDDAAGGSDPQTSGEVLKLAPAREYMRGRALTTRDLQMLALQSSRDIAQARAVTSGSAVQLVVATTSPSRIPTQAQQRALLAFLTPLSTPSLAAQISIASPVLLQVTVSLMLDIGSVDDSGAVALAVADAIQALFDPATGGIDGQGWPLGVLPTSIDIEAALADIPELLAIETVALSCSLNNAVVLTTLPTYLPVAAAQDIQVEFTVTPVEVGA